MNKPVLNLEFDLFSEDQLCDSKSIISKYFDIQPISVDILLKSNNNPSGPIRASLNVARMMNRKFEYANAMQWVSFLREYALSPSSTYFNDLEYIKNHMSERAITSHFIRPCDPFKTFSGQVFESHNKFLQEYNFITKNLNIKYGITILFVTHKLDLIKDFKYIYKVVDKSLIKYK
jgi:hypothetical protein